jgi:hypothetical protein
MLRNQIGQGAQKAASVFASCDTDKQKIVATRYKQLMAETLQMDRITFNSMVKMELRKIKVDTI